MSASLPCINSNVPMLTDSVATNPVRTRAVGRLEPCAGKLACTVLRGEHAGNGVFLPDGKARKPYEFGFKNAVVVSHKLGLMLGARTFPGNPYDGHILSAVLEQATNLTQDLSVTIEQVVADLGFVQRQRGRCRQPARADHSSRQVQEPEQAGAALVEAAPSRGAGHRAPEVGPPRLDRCWLKGALGDALHAISCAAGYNLRWLLRAIARPGIGPAFCVCFKWRCGQLGPHVPRMAPCATAPARPTTGNPGADRLHHGDLTLAFA